MKRICFYISSHGFGHATREIEIISHLPNEIEVEIVTAAPRWLFERSLERPFQFREMNHDPGILQRDSLHQDVESTLAHWQELLRLYPALAREEAHHLQTRNVTLVVGDISPFAPAVGRAGHIPSVIIANFSWDWIFQVFRSSHPAFGEIINRIAELYRHTDLLLRTPLSGDLSVFPVIQDIPIVARRSQKTREEARRELGIAPETKVTLISLGGHGFNRIPKERLMAYPDILFLTFLREWSELENVRFLDPQTTYHPDALRASDLVLAKMGYGIATECIAHGIPMAYPPRHDFPEHDILERETHRHILTLPLSEETFLHGPWDFLNTFFSEDRWGAGRTGERSIPVDGGETAARILGAWANRDCATP